MTLPGVIRGYKNKVRVTKLKKAYSVLSGAYTTLTSRYGEIESWTSADLSSISGASGSQTQLFSNDVGDKFAEVISHGVVCAQRTNSIMKKCLGNASSMPFLDGTGNSGLPYYAMSTNDFEIGFGPYVYLNEINNPKIKKKIYMQIYVVTDIQSANNAFGRNIFVFLLTDKGIIPGGTGNYSSFNSYNMLPYDVYCSDAGVLKRGLGCTAWVLTHENFDYK